MIELSKQEARKIALASQLLKRPSVNGQSPKRLARETIEQIGYVQIDTISVVERAHHHVLHSRLTTYSQDLLASLEHERAIFEYWSHAASYLPMRDFRFTLPMKQEIRAQDKFWFEKDQRLMRRVMDRIDAEGPLMSKDFEKPEGFKVTQMWEAAPTKRALQNLFMEGKLMVRGRQGFQKIYDLTERVLPSGLDISTPSREEYIHFLIERDIRAHGVIATKEMGYLLKGCQKEIREQCLQLEERGTIIPCKIRGIKEPYFMSTEALTILNKRLSQQVKLLNPFDNALINRARTSDLFGFDYVLECYLPAADRAFGYFSLPILWKNNLVGLVDLKANRHSRELQIRNLVLKPQSINDDFLEGWHKAMAGFMDFQGSQVTSLAQTRSTLNSDLLQALFPSK